MSQDRVSASVAVALSGVGEIRVTTGMVQLDIKQDIELLVMLFGGSLSVLL